MPLLTSPIDGSPMRQIHRYGIEIDVCPTTGGIWLDKGELEKLMMLIRDEALTEASPQPDPNYSAPQGHRQERDMSRSRERYDDDDDDDDRRRRGGRRSRLLDIFDF